MSRQLEVLIHGLGHNDLAASSRVLLRQVLRKRRDVWGRFCVRIWSRQVLHRGSGKTGVSSFSTIFSWSPPSVGGGRRFGKVIFRRKVPRDEQTRSQEIKRSVSSMPSSLPAVLEMCRHKFVHLFFLFNETFLFFDCSCFLLDYIFAFRLWMYLTLSDVDICKAKEEGLKKLLKEYRFSKDVYRCPWLMINDYWYNNKQMLKNKCDKKC